MTQSESNNWLIRTIENEIRGPFTRDELVDQIKSGKLNHQDEVCQGNNYWIYLDERDEVLAQLGLDIPRAASGSGEDESTDTETETITQDISVAFKTQETGATQGDASAGSTQAPSIAAIRERAAARHPSPIRPFPEVQTKPLVLGGIERPSFWRFVFSVLFIFASILVAWVVRVLQIAS